MLKASKSAAKTMQDQIEMSIRPYGTINVFYSARQSNVLSSYYKYGRIAADNLRLKIDRDFFVHGSKAEKGITWQS